MQLLALNGIAEVRPGDDVAQLIVAAIEANDIVLSDGDVIAIAQKIISKAEGRYVYLDEVTASAEAESIAKECAKDPRLVQLILDESNTVLRLRPGVIVVEHKHGYVHANAGIDRSNLVKDERELVLLLPKDSDQSALKIQQYLSAHFHCHIGVLINDSAGRAWRVGTVGMAIGTAGFTPLLDLIGTKDRAGRVMEVTQLAVADELAAAASYMMGQGSEGRPVVVIQGADVRLDTVGSKALIRDKKTDLFR
jgi:coenzyme F420-0:L-glutamate ligase/coenzyme F420-1:gamma-L-glutamate ligase